MTAMTDEQVDLLRSVLEHITAHPETWDQDKWAVRTECGTSFCVAGHVAVKKGMTPEWSPQVDWPGDEIFDIEGAYVASSVTDSEGDYYDIPSFAAEAVGLDYLSANMLFHWGNTLPALWRIAGELSDGRIVTPAGVS